MRVAVIGPAGFGGSVVCIELLNRGHEVIGISRKPETFGSHEHYKPLQLDISGATIPQLIETFKDVDVVVNAFNPPYSPTVYKLFVETTRRLVIAAKAAQLTYFISIGGTGSLFLGPEYPYQTAADSREFWLAYRQATADSEAATYHMEERIGFGSPVAKMMREYRDARSAVKAGRASEDQKRVIKEVEKGVLEGPDPVPDLPLAARAGFMFLEADTSWRWSFVSPPGKYMPGPRTGKYQVVIDQVPFAPVEGKAGGEGGNAFEGRLLGISAADLAVAMVDEIEKPEKVHKHWSAVAELPAEQERVPSYARLNK
ncbi:hypothetical protein BAUCODRAFT_114956 [Baudoinia panamericana UAMH 10762]|uniref:NAD-dependent epimerase/dehydratase domain-containing protein n=1 Tax=Baudoinia panamericana (strain UAMH 10762) TaxID=717646 RepID=M2N2N6_BAUPA|nr:uncharacterized protein BAUCODRAFT_114956 [Baudoinia panamericana UAMH 10762]EMC92925.1 hypothetical protein BAUCODRAFT_114956 [Baudoinia panamericana UAMH 10762]